MSDQASLFVPTQHGEQPAPYPWGPAARATDTSREAAAAIAPRDDTLKRMVLTILRDTPEGLTADEVAGTLHESVLAIRPRCTELAKLGYVVDSGSRRPNVSGRRAIVWRVP